MTYKLWVVRCLLLLHQTFSRCAVVFTGSAVHVLHVVKWNRKSPERNTTYMLNLNYTAEKLLCVLCIVLFDLTVEVLFLWFSNDYPHSRLLVCADTRRPSQEVLGNSSTTLPFLLLEDGFRGQLWKHYPFPQWNDFIAYRAFLSLTCPCLFDSRATVYWLCVVLLRFLPMVLAYGGSVVCSCPKHLAVALFNNVCGKYQI